jgi:hypothetical protein
MRDLNREATVGDEPQDQTPNHMMGGIAGGLLMGLLSAVPICLNMCCMLWAGGGGVLAAYVASQRARTYGPGDGAMSGLFAAGAGWLLHSIINVPLQLVLGSLMPAQQPPPGFPPELAPLLKPGNPLALLVGQLIILFIFLIMSCVGGVVGGLIFKKEPKDVV